MADKNKKGKAPVPRSELRHHLQSHYAYWLAVSTMAMPQGAREETIAKIKCPCEWCQKLKRGEFATRAQADAGKDTYQYALMGAFILFQMFSFLWFPHLFHSIFHEVISTLFTVQFPVGVLINILSVFPDVVFYFFVLKVW